MGGSPLSPQFPLRLGRRIPDPTLQEQANFTRWPNSRTKWGVCSYIPALWEWKSVGQKIVNFDLSTYAEPVWPRWTMTCDPFVVASLLVFNAVTVFVSHGSYLSAILMGKLSGWKEVIW